MNKLQSLKRRWIAPALCALLSVTALAQDAAPKTAAAARAAIGAALQARQIPQALQAYDTAVAQSGPSVELLAPIARADLAYCLDNGKSWDRIEAARALAVLGDERGKEALVAELRGPHSQVRHRVALLAADAGLTEAIPELKKALAGRDAGDAERVALAQALYRLGEEEPGRSTLAELSGSEDPRVRFQAVRALVLVDDKESLPTFRERMEREDGPKGAALWAARGAARQGDAAGRRRLQEWMAGDSPSLRVQAAWHLRGAGVTDFVPAARQLTESALEDLNDPLLGLGFSAYLLSWLDPDVGQPFLERVLALEGHLGPRMMALRRLAELRHDTALAQIREVFQETSGSAAHRADLVRFASWVGDSPQLREFLSQAAGEESEIVQLEALEILAGLGVADALGPLRELLTAPLLARQIRAAEALIHFGEGVSSAPDMWASGSALGPRWG